MIDHFGVVFRDLTRARAFYAAALAPLGYSALREFPSAEGGVVGFGVAPKPDFWIAAGAAPTPAMHFAFRAESRAAVDAFHVAALAAGGVDNGAPGLRPQYHPEYYAAFVIDPEGHNIEAVHHGPGF